jgi:hypothetical protein
MMPNTITSLDQIHAAPLHACPPDISTVNPSYITIDGPLLADSNRMEGPCRATPMNDVLTPDLLTRPINWMTILPDRWSSTTSNSPM